MRQHLFHRNAAELRRLRRRINTRAFALDEPHIAAHGVEHQQDVGEQDGAVHAIAPNRLQRGFRGQGGGITEIQEPLRLGAKLQVFGKMPSSLTHHPDGNRIDPFPVQHSSKRLFVSVTHHPDSLKPSF